MRQKDAAHPAACNDAVELILSFSVDFLEANERKKYVIKIARNVNLDSTVPKKEFFAFLQHFRATHHHHKEEKGE